MGSKRKACARALSATKKVKIQYGSLDSLPWKSTARPVDTGLDGDDGILELEEVNDVEVVYENTDGGKVVTFNVLQRPSAVDEPASPATTSVSKESLVPDAFTFDAALLPNWREFSLHPHLLQVLYRKSYTTPTPIQSRAIVLALDKRDVVGVAETGSGKTLAYGLPILHHILSQSQRTQHRTPSALILAPTRELALQVSDHLEAFARTPDTDPTVKVEEEEKERGPSMPLVSIAVLVGGMSAQKQRRLLDRGADVLIATPGRLWDTLQEDPALAHHVQNLRFLVLDEADRMIEAGHFAEMDNILRLTVRRSEDDKAELDSEDKNGDARKSLQTLVFSATLSRDLQRNLKKIRSRTKSGKKGNARPPTTLDDLLLRLDFRDPEPAIIDLSPERGVVSTLQESKIECLTSEKDVYLYYFLLRYPGRSLVFLSAIDGIRRLTPLLELLNLTVFPLHSQLEQRQRLKNLDRFKATPNAILLATDIAARGLDVPCVDHVIHYQVPRSADVLIHRNGRTARAKRKGFSLLMCSPEERRIVTALLGSLGRQDADVADMAVELTLLDDLKARIRLAREIDARQHRVKKENHERNWLKEAAEAMEIELDSDVVSASSEDDARGGRSRQQRKRAEGQLAGMKAELKAMLARPLIARGVSTRYITSGSRPIADDILTGKVHDAMLGLTRTDAGSDVRRRRSVEPKEEAEEEWLGIR